jgi:hypothetical protein
VLERHKEPTEPADLVAAFESLQQVAHKVAEAMYKGAGGGDAGNYPGETDQDDAGDDAGGDDVSDAEFVESNN